MGCFDTVFGRCTECGEKVEIQTKSGLCAFSTYRISNVPADIAMSIIDMIVTCPSCHAELRIDGHVERVKLEFVLVEDSSEEEI